jgi:diguanylate cyclase (GGDEF)-like protein
MSRTMRDERTYLRARVVLCVGLGLLLAVGIPLPGGGAVRWMYLFELAMLVGGTAWGYASMRRGPGRLGKAMLWALPADFMAIASFTYLLHAYDDGFYPVALLMPVTYALIANRREVLIASTVAAIAVLVGHVPSGVESPLDAVFLVLKCAAIPLLGLIVSTSFSRERQLVAASTREVAVSQDENVQLNKRLEQLKAVSEITELVHSSLDFDRVGALVIEILGTMVDVDSCSLFVIDKRDSETLFSTSLGDVSGVTARSAMALTSAPAEHFTCRSIFDHGDAIVLFCAPQVDMERLGEEEHLILGAIASELVVAVENSRLYHLTKRLAITDELTGLYNYREVQNRLTQEMDRAVRYGKQLSLLMLDVDEFKSFNDRFGHIVGDRALAELGAVLRSSVREVDVAARYGGEEFSVILPETDATGAYVVAEKIRDTVAQHRFVVADDERVRALTVSVGIATYPTYASDKEELLRQADGALYRAKREGKDCVRAPRRASDVAGTAPEAVEDEPENTADFADEAAADRDGGLTAP